VGPGRMAARNVRRVMHGEELYEMTVMRDGGQWYWAVMRSGRSSAGWHLGVLHAGGEAANERDAWSQARRAVPRRSRHRGGQDALFLSLGR
jgi:hypothetical protein